MVAALKGCLRDNDGIGVCLASMTLQETNAAGLKGYLGGEGGGSTLTIFPLLVHTLRRT